VANRDLLLGIDVGTYESKGVLCTSDGQVVAHAAVGHELSIPHPGWAEHDAEGVWWRDFVFLCRELLASPGASTGRVAGVGVSAIAPCVLPIDRAGRPLRAGILYGVDTRTKDEIAELEGRFGRETIFSRSGLNLSTHAAGPKILWIKNHEPEIWKNAAVFLTASGYLVFKLTGERVIDIYTAGAYAPLFDGQRNAWDAEMAAPIVPLEKLPRLLWSMQIAGSVTEEAARQTGLPAGTPVVAGTADAAAEALSAGLSQPGDLMLMYGSSQFFLLKMDRLVASRKFWGHAFLEPGSYSVTAGMSTTGSLTRWFRDNFGEAERAIEQTGGRKAYEALADLAAQSPRGARGLVALPYFSGERSPVNDPDARGLVIGMTLAHTRADLYRAFLEGIGYGIRHVIDALREDGVSPARILAVGGGTKNPLWLSIVSDIARIDQYVPDQTYGAAYGGAFMAGVGLGWYTQTSDITSWIHYERLVASDPEAHAFYEDYYQVYRQLYSDNAEAMHRLAQLAH
jgi:xylulokinase